MRMASDTRGAVDIFRLVEEDLQQVESRLLSQVSSQVPAIDEMNRYLHKSGGKRLRPGLLLLCSKLCGAPAEPSQQLGMVVELIHVATLVHDDIIDHSLVRRGRASLNAKWGNDLTVLFGDWLYMTAFWIALQERNFRLLDLLIGVTRKMVEGEFLQHQWRWKIDLTAEEHLKICWHKTAHLFSTSSRLPAALVDDPALDEPLSEFGRALGMAFQLTDDLLDYSSSEKVLGKPVLKDLREGNITRPLIDLWASADSEESSFLEEVVQSRRVTEDDQVRIAELIKKYDALRPTRELAREFAAEAKGYLNELPESPYRDALRQLPELVINRSK